MAGVKYAVVAVRQTRSRFLSPERWVSWLVVDFSCAGQTILR
jgi:hypothetical protein